MIMGEIDYLREEVERLKEEVISIKEKVKEKEFEEDSDYIYLD